MGITRRQLTQDIGHTGFEYHSGRVESDFLREWNGAERVKHVDQMLRNSPIVGAMNMAIRMQLLNIDWFFTSELGDRDPRLEIINQSLDNMIHSLHDHIGDAMLFPYYGWSAFPVIYERVNGRILWRKFKRLAHDSVMHWEFDDRGEVTGLQQWPYLHAPVIPTDRMLHYTFDGGLHNPEGESVLRTAWLPFFISTNLQEIEAIGIERNLNGLPIIVLPEHADTNESGADMTRAQQVVRNVRWDEQAGVTLPFGWELKLLSGGGLSKSIDTNMVIARHEKRMLMSILAQFLMLGMDNVGALATFEGGNSFFNAVVNSIADEPANVITKQELPRLMQWNGQDARGLKLEHSPAGDIDLEKVGRFFQIAAPHMSMTAQDQMWMRSLLGMPELTPEEIEEAEELERERAMQNIPPALRRNAQPDEEQPEDDEGGDDFAARTRPPDDAPDRRRRQRLEREWYKTASTFFAEQEKRIAKAAERTAV